MFSRDENSEDSVFLTIKQTTAIFLQENMLISVKASKHCAVLLKVKNYTT